MGEIDPKTEADGAKTDPNTGTEHGPKPGKEPAPPKKDAKPYPGRTGRLLAVGAVAATLVAGGVAVGVSLKENRPPAAEQPAEPPPDAEPTTTLGNSLDTPLPSIVPVTVQPEVLVDTAPAVATAQPATEATAKATTTIQRAPVPTLPPHTGVVPTTATTIRYDGPIPTTVPRTTSTTRFVEPAPTTSSTPTPRRKA